MKIVRITKQERRDRYNLYSEEGFVASLAPDTLLEAGVSVGVEVTSQQLAAWQQQDQASQALAKAYDLLSRRPHSVGELCDKLRRKEFAESDISDTVERLTKVGYLDDRPFTERWVAERGGTRGKHLLRAELAKKGVDRTIVDEVLGGQDSDSSEIINLIAKRAPRYAGKDAFEFRQKITQYLAGRGYGYDDIKTALQEYESSKPES
jgi:regulatory protein